MVGALLAAMVFGDFKLQWFVSLRDSVRYVIGAVMMGLGGVLALGCTVGALSNAVVMVTSSWIALAAMATGAIVVDRLIDAARHDRQTTPRAGADLAKPGIVAG